jgi:hypothetical protein
MAKLNIHCYDKPGTIDRYTVVYLDYPVNGKHGYFEYVGMNCAPFAPQGFGQHGQCKDGSHLGKRIRFDELPLECQKLVKHDLEDSKGARAA